MSRGEAVRRDLIAARRRLAAGLVGLEEYGWELSVDEVNGIAFEVQELALTVIDINVEVAKQRGKGAHRKSGVKA